MDNNFLFNGDSSIDDSNADKKVENISKGTDEDYLFAGIKKASLEDENGGNVLKCYSCHSCNTKYLSTSSDDTCIFCGEKGLSEEEIPGMINTYYLPFTNTIEDAKKDYKKRIRFKILVPFSFRSKKNIDKMKKVYVPIVIRNCKIYGQIYFYGADNIKGGKKDDTRKYEVCQSVNLDFSNIFKSCYSKIDEEDFPIIKDYNYSMSSMYNNNVITDSNCIIGDIEGNVLDEKITNILQKCAVSMVRENVNHDLKKLKQSNTALQTTTEQRLLLPIYMLNIRRKNKDYTYIMNAQNGKSSMKLDISILNVVIFSVLSFALIFAIVYLIAKYV